MIKAVLFDNDGVLSRWTVPRPAMRRLVKDLRDRDIKVGMLSNVIWPSAQVYKIWRSYNGFDVLLLSYREKLSKPDLGYYQLAIEKFGVKPSEILFVDNKKQLLAPAQKLGFKTLHSTSAKQVERDIKAIIFKENAIQL